MKVELRAIDGHHTFVELKEVDSPKGFKSLEFTTVFERSREPHERQAYRLLLDDECLNKLREVLK